MLISKNILGQYMDLSNISSEELAAKVTAAGFEVEGYEALASGSNLVIGEILTCEKHPDSDHLHVCSVDTKDKVLQIVCGAPNARVGLKVIVAKVGAKLPELTIKAGVIRGVESNGMLCSLLELGVDAKTLNETQKAGIEELDADAEVGNEEVLAYLGLDDVVFDISLTPNRNDCLSVFSFAKEVGAILNIEVNLPISANSSDIGEETDLVVSSQSTKCPLYSGKIVNEVTIKESPMWMKKFLSAVGVKSINNVVDISNIVMLETAQPLHFFDLKKLAKKEIIVKEGFSCTYTALDGVDYKVEENDLMISVDDKIVAIAGIMGGEDSKVDEKTTSLLIEAASFDHVSIRNSARKFNLSTDASIRYQKGIEPNAPYTAMDRAIQLLIEYADAKGFEKTVYSGNTKTEDRQLEVSPKRINERLGTNISTAEMLDVLTRLRFQPTLVNENIVLQVPSTRQDIEIEADISEEIIRMIGFDGLQSTLPKMSSTVGKLDTRQSLRRTLRNIFTNRGFYEAQTYTLISDGMDKDAILPLEQERVQLASPMSEDRKIIRSSILPSLLTSVAYNKKRSLKDVALFEISNVYRKDVVQERLAFAFSGSLQQTRWMKLNIEASFYSAKGLLVEALEHLGYNASRVMFKENTMDTKHFHPYQSACVYIGRDLLGVFGMIHPNMAKQYDSEACVIGEFNLEVILQNKTSKVKYTGISKYPSLTRDLAFVVREEVSAAEIIKSITKNGKQIISNVEVFDVYMGEHVEKGFKSIALSIVFQAKDHTLTEQEVADVHNKILVTLEKDVQAQLRK